MKYYIYKIKDSKNESEFYIGSTTRFSSRKSHHKKNTNNKVSKKYWCKLYQYIRANGNWDSFNMVILEEGEAENRNIIKQKEQEYINNMKPTLNSINACK